MCYELKRAKGNNVEIQNTLELNYGVGYMRRSGTKYSSRVRREVKRPSVSEKTRMLINRMADERMH